jgi:hypothetical protein
VSVSTTSRGSWILGGAGLALLMALGAVMRVPLLTLGLSRDEAATFFDIQAASLSGVIQTVNFSELNPPGFFVAMYYWTQLFGDTEVIFKLLAFVFGILLISATYWLGLEASRSRAAASLAAALIALAPEPAYYSQEARPYTMAALVVALASGCFLRGMRERGRWAPVAGYVLFGALAPYVHYTNLALIGALGLISLAAMARKQTGTRDVRLVVGGLAILVCFAPWMPTFFEHLNTGTPWALPTPLVERPRLIFDNLTYVVPVPLVGAPYDLLRRTIAALLGGLLIVALWRRRADGASTDLRAQSAALAVALALVIVAGLLGMMSFNRRYMFPFLPLAATAVAWLVTSAGARLTRRWRNTTLARLPALTGAIVGLTCLAVDAAYVASLATRDKSGVRALASDARELGRDTLFLVAPDVHAATLGYYLRGTGIELHGVPQWTRPEVFGPHTYLELWERPRLVGDLKERIRHAAAQGVAQLALVQPRGGIVDAGRLPMSRAREVVAFIEQHYPALYSRDYPGVLESLSLHVFDLSPASHSETASARRF